MPPHEMSVEDMFCKLEAFLDKKISEIKREVDELVHENRVSSENMVKMQTEFALFRDHVMQYMAKTDERFKLASDELDVEITKANDHYRSDKAARETFCDKRRDEIIRDVELKIDSMSKTDRLWAMGAAIGVLGMIAWSVIREILLQGGK